MFLTPEAKMLNIKGNVILVVKNTLVGEDISVKNLAKQEKKVKNTILGKAIMLLFKGEDKEQRECTNLNPAKFAALKNLKDIM